MTPIFKEIQKLNAKKKNIETVNLLESLGFTILEKSVLKPSKCLEFLGFVTNSVDMTVEINEMKAQAIINIIQRFFEHNKRTITLLASVIGSCISLFPAMPFEKLCYRNLEKEKTNGLTLHKGNFNGKLGKLKPMLYKSCIGC